MAKLARHRILVFAVVCVFLLAGIFFIFELIDKTTLAVLEVEQYEVRIIYDRDNHPILWASGVGGLVWDATGNDRYFTGNMSGQSGYDLAQDAIVELDNINPDRFTITDFESNEISEWEVVVEEDGLVIVREVTIQH